MPPADTAAVPDPSGPGPDPAPAPPRIAVVNTAFGIPSEPWIIRQAEAFTRLDPVYMAPALHEGGLPLPAGRRLVRLPPVLDPPRGLVRRAVRRAGLAWGMRATQADRAQLRAAILAERPAAVLCHFAWTAIPVAAALGREIPVIAHFHGRDVSTFLDRPAFAAALREALPRLAHAIIVGRFQEARLAALVPGRMPPVSLIPCGAPFDAFGATEAAPRTAGDPFRILAIGRVSAEKGVMDTLAAFERLAGSLPDAELTIVGDGPDMAALRAAAARHPAAARIRLTGMLPPEGVAAEIARAHAFTQHSRPHGGWIEGFGVTLVEAGAAGLPLVASDFGGIPDQVSDGENGILFAPGDIDAQAQALARLAGDETLRRGMGAAARRVARGYDSRAMAARLENVILSTLASAGG